MKCTKSGSQEEGWVTQEETVGSPYQSSGDVLIFVTK